MRWIVLLFCGWLAATVSGAAGFGGALLLLPILAATMGKAAHRSSPWPNSEISLRQGFGWCDIRWRPALIFTIRAIPASIIGSRLFVELPPAWVSRLIGIFILVLIAVRHTPLRRRSIPRWFLIPAGACVGFLSALAGEECGAARGGDFLGLNLPARAYVASEGVTAVFLHLTKSVAYGRCAALTVDDCLSGLALGGSLVFGSWTGRRLIDRLPGRWYALLIELLLAVSSISLLLA